MTLFGELKRRKVFRVAAAYAVMAWLLLQVADILLDNFGAPEWVFKSFTVLLVLGFLPAVILAWVFDLTPGGLQRTPDEAPAETGVTPGSGMAGRERLTNRIILVGAFLIIVVMATERIWFAGRGSPADAPSAAPAATLAEPDGETAAADPARSIAVLAFDDLSPEGDQAYFAEGISEELLNLLARSEGFRVAARTSSFKFKGSDADIGEIGQALNVETVLEGSVRKAGDQVRITAQLIEVGSGFHIWSDTYDRRLENIFAVQDEIAAAIVRALQLELDVGVETAGRTQNVAAYDLYLRGRQLAREPTRAGLLQAIELYEEALTLDPRFAGAYSGIAEAWTWLEDYGGIPSAEAFPKAEQAARRALALDPQSAEAHAAMAFVRDRYYSDAVGASRYFERTLELNPNYVTAYNIYGDVLRDIGNLERMIEVHRKAVELDPLSVFMRTRLASKLLDVGKYDESRALLDEVLAEYPDNDYAKEELGNLARQQGRFADAIREFRFVHFARPGDPYSAAQIVLAATFLDDRALAEAWIEEARRIGENNRWELFARHSLAEAEGDWATVAEIGAVRGGPVGAFLRGLAASRSGAWHEARRLLLESLQLANYDAVQGARLIHMASLLELAWVERQLDMEGWDERAANIEKLIRYLLGQGGAYINWGTTTPSYDAARLAAIRGDRDTALRELRTTQANHWLSRWFLEHDHFFSAWREDPDFIALVAAVEEHLAAERAKLAGMEVGP
jgi:TolB-like protein/Tfp pilus assembly protein PilF